MSPHSELHERGFARLPQVLDAAACGAVRDLLGDAEGAGSRGVLRLAEVMKLARTLLTDLVRPYLPGVPVPVRGIYFDKRPGTNWLVAWHQDLTLALKERSEVPGWGPLECEGRRAPCAAACGVSGANAHRASAP